MNSKVKILFDREIDEIIKGLKSITRDVAVISADAFDNNFRTQSFFGTPWKPSKYTMNKEGKSRKLLQKSGALRKSIRYKINAQTIEFSSALPYANIHNEGGTINHPGGTAYSYDKKKSRAVWISNRKAAGKNYSRTKAHKIPIDKRQFIGDSKALDKLIENHINKILK